jgi:hypothetical protein
MLRIIAAKEKGRGRERKVIPTGPPAPQPVTVHIIAAIEKGPGCTDETHEIYDCISPGPFALPVRIIAAIEKGRDGNEERSFVAVTRPRPSSCPCY